LTRIQDALARSYVDVVLVQGHLDRLADFVDEEGYAEHDPQSGDGVSALRSTLERESRAGRRIDYQRIHRVLAEGSFVLCVSEGSLEEKHTAFYDLFRMAQGKVVEHWCTREKIAPRCEWKNENGKF